MNIFKRLLRAAGLFSQNDLQIEVIKRVERMRLEPGDIIVISTERPISADAVLRMRATVKAFLDDPNRKVMILDNGVGIKILPGPSAPTTRATP